MQTFEGYEGIRLWEEQLADDVIFSLLLCLFVLFAIVFRTHIQSFMKMTKDAFQVKERQTLFDGFVGRNNFIFRNFMTVQAIALATIAIVSIGKIYDWIDYTNGLALLWKIVIVFGGLFLFYQLKQLSYYVLGYVFADPDKYKLWKTNYNAIIGIWGISLYIPVLWLVFVKSYVMLPVFLFLLLYILSRFVIIYKTIRIFHTKSTGFLYINLYLCALEILPLVFLYEGIVYCLYNFVETSALWR
jgi:hypothetical protein